MKLAQLKEIAIQKNLILHKYGRNFVRNKYIYSKTKDILDSELIRIEKVPYKRYTYLARTTKMPEHENYKITAKDYRELLKDGAIEET